MAVHHVDGAEPPADVSALSSTAESGPRTPGAAAGRCSRSQNVEVVLQRDRPSPSAASRLSVPPGERRRAARRQRRRQDHDHPGHLGAARTSTRPRTAPARSTSTAGVSTKLRAARDRRPRRRPGPRGPHGLRRAHGRGEPARRRGRPQGRRRRRGLRRPGLRAVPADRRPPQRPGRMAVGRRAADGGGRPGADGRPPPAPPRRALARPRAARRRRTIFERLDAAPQGARDGHAGGRAERRARARVLRYGYIIENGRIVLEGPAPSCRKDSDVQELYLGGSGPRDQARSPRRSTTSAEAVE